MKLWPGLVAGVIGGTFGALAHQSLYVTILTSLIALQAIRDIEREARK